MTAPSDLFAEAVGNDLVGLAVTMPDVCPRCNGTAAAIGAGRAMHAASLMCACGRHLGWMSAETFNFVSESVRLFGRPVAPVEVRVKSKEKTNV